MNISLVTSLFPEVNPTYHERRFPYAQLAFMPSKELLSVPSIYKVLELCPRDLFSHTKKRLVGVDKNIAFNKKYIYFYVTLRKNTAATPFCNGLLN